ncbi:methylmalonyl-CoA mutase family protein [Novosphingobium sp. 9U]|uniref:methylmalonyl-CoA mutase family protein n=1 Tax=Novosphingobium sp. 9U TaxID=2653158 RepID=UPI0012F2BA17|nr:methylmalonyl-CoA mutase family protein [Novosphingobium sp. 9U]VWX50166.1 Methylmalonyl-CoA mutase, N-terminal domain [Novosphingobium sp. 9U]
MNAPITPANTAVPALDPQEVSLSRTSTWSGTETADFYGPQPGSDPAYAEKLGDPGQYPFTRGSYPKMYRSRMWTLRNIVGYGAPEDTLEGIHQSLAGGSTGINIVFDVPTQQGIDPDHPAFGMEVGLEGCSVPSLPDMERLLADIDITRTDVAWHATLFAYTLCAAMAKRRGIPLDHIQGSHMPDHLQQTLSGWGTRIVPTDLAHRATVDCVEFCVRNSPRWALGMPQAYDLRERGATPAAEIAFGMAIINKTMEDLQTRGLHVDQVAPSIAWVSTSDIDFFEEVAKFRALRRIWARTMHERFGAQDARSMRLRAACHTSGKSLVFQQPINNITRAAIQSFAALCGGVQSLEACTYDEPVSIPTVEAREIATRTQQILAHEVGAARVADPLGGSYYVEALTDGIERDALALLAEVEGMGLLNAVESGFIEGWMDEANLRFEEELEAGARLQVGKNCYQAEGSHIPPRFAFNPANTQEHIERFKAMKRDRDQSSVTNALRRLHADVREGRNMQPGMIDAFLASASIGETWGMVRLGMGQSYDPYNTVTCPFDLS